ncbi:hypothetical protein BDZ91DRAFT_145707 [Kalaharituber pfeilii]|nr:hypothetical protein BDZ91DRAFT_145707 [Kalaharituber pfeilii]
MQFDIFRIFVVFLSGFEISDQNVLIKGVRNHTVPLRQPSISPTTTTALTPWHTLPLAGQPQPALLGLELLSVPAKPLVQPLPALAPLQHRRLARCPPKKKK